MPLNFHFRASLTVPSVHKELELRIARLLGLKASMQGADKKRHVVVTMAPTCRGPPDDGTLQHVGLGMGKVPALRNQ